MKYTNLIYDFDGTLSDSYPIFTRALLIFLERRGISETYDEALRRLKISVGAALRSYPLEGDEKEISREYRHIREELARQEMKPIDGAEEQRGWPGRKRRTAALSSAPIYLGAVISYDFC